MSDLICAKCGAGPGLWHIIDELGPVCPTCDPDMNIRVKCEHCKSVFAMTDRGSRVLNALRTWDQEHKHETLGATENA